MHKPRRPRGRNDPPLPAAGTGCIQSMAFSTKKGRHGLNVMFSLQLNAASWEMWLV